VAKAGGRPYEPVEIAGKRFDNVRDSEGRWQAVAKVLDRYAVRNVLDVGCAEGWFVRQAAADRNCFAIGIEATDALFVGELARLHDRVERAATIRAFMTPEALRSLPKFDAVICMSVVHHIIRAFGVESAEQFVKALASRVEKVLIFEIGTAGESSWTAHLPGESRGQETFVRGFLERCGFHKIRIIAETPSYHREVQRLLFAAEPLRDAQAGTDQQTV
jgi:SAM-dependent methyltransferase